MPLNKARAEHGNPRRGPSARAAGVQIGCCCGIGAFHIRRLSGKLTHS